jgi:hypothetical protein
MTRELVDDLVLHLKGLVLGRDLLATRGATKAELDEHSAEIERIRDRLARIERDREGFGAAA